MIADSWYLMWPKTKRQDDAYFTSLRDELDTGGLAAMLSDLLAHPVNQALLRHPPVRRASAK